MNECAAFGFSGLSKDTLRCIDGLNNRTIVCENGFLAALPTRTNVTLVGNTSFSGCFGESSVISYTNNFKLINVPSTLLLAK